MNDPWVEHTVHETPSAAANLPIPFGEFRRMAIYGKGVLRDALVVRRARAP